MVSIIELNNQIPTNPSTVLPPNNSNQEPPTIITTTIHWPPKLLRWRNLITCDRRLFDFWTWNFISTNFQPHQVAMVERMISLGPTGMYPQWWQEEINSSQINNSDERRTLWHTHFSFFCLSSGLSSFIKDGCRLKRRLKCLPFMLINADGRSAGASTTTTANTALLRDG